MIALRPVGPDDGTLLLEVYASTRAEEMALAGWDEAQKDAFVRMQFEAQRSWYEQQYPDASFDVVVVDGEPAGRLYVDRRGDAIDIVDIALLREFRGRGIGSGLLRQLLDEAAGAGKVASIHVERFNRARRLYDRLGFVVAEDKGIHLLMEWRPQVNTAS